MNNFNKGLDISIQILGWFFDIVMAILGFFSPFILIVMIVVSVCVAGAAVYGFVEGLIEKSKGKRS